MNLKNYSNSIKEGEKQQIVKDGVLSYLCSFIQMDVMLLIWSKNHQQALYKANKEQSGFKHNNRVRAAFENTEIMFLVFLSGDMRVSATLEEKISPIII